VAHAIAWPDLAQNVGYLPRLRQNYAPNRLELQLTHCCEYKFSLARIFWLSQRNGHLLSNNLRHIGDRWAIGAAISPQQRRGRRKQSELRATRID